MIHPLSLAIRLICFVADYRPYSAIRYHLALHLLVRKAELAILQAAVLNHCFRHLVIQLAILAPNSVGTILSLDLAGKMGSIS